MKFSSKIVVMSIALGLLGTTVSPIAAKYKKRDKQEQEAPRTKKSAAPAVLFGAGTGGLAAGLAGSAKWAPLGIVGGAFAGWGLWKAIQNNRQRRNDHKRPMKKEGRRHLKDRELDKK